MDTFDLVIKFSCLSSLKDAWEALKSDTERKRKLLVIIFPDWSKFTKTARDLEMNLEAMDSNIKVANINREIHKVRLLLI